MRNDVDDLKQAYASRIFSYVNDNPGRFVGHEAKTAAMPRPRRPAVELAQELLILPGRPWWMFWRPTPTDPMPGTPKPPGWTPEWQWRYPDRSGPVERRWFDPKGGEFRWHAPDRKHPDGHWDYNPWQHWNHKWRNVMPPREGPFGAPPIAPIEETNWI
jgi:hypothetical protein